MSDRHDEITEPTEVAEEDPPPRLDPETRAYWEQRDALGRRRITLFARGLYRHGMLGVFIGLAHRTARLYGADPRQMTKARTLSEQRAYFDTAIARTSLAGFVVGDLEGGCDELPDRGGCDDTSA